jgi:drug/metabolite transporter (DMT)-like permease
MTPSRTHSLKTSVLVALIVVFGSAGNLCFDVGMKRVGALRGWSPVALRAAFMAVFSSSWIWFGIVSMLMFMAALMLVLSWADFSYVLPATAAMYVVIPLVGHFVLRESVTGMRWVGVALICLGVAFVGQTPLNTTKGG